MVRRLLPFASFVFLTSFAAAAPQLPGVGPAMDGMIAAREIAGAVTIVATREKMIHLQSHGHADLAARRPIAPDSLFWIASMTKPVTAVAILMLQDEGKVSVTDPVAKFIPEFAQLRTPAGKPAAITLSHLLTHTSGLTDATLPQSMAARSLADLVPAWTGAPLRFEPGTQWQYNQAGINAAARVVEIVSGMTFDAFLQQRLFDPLGLKDTTFYPNEEQRRRLAPGYAKAKPGGELQVAPPREQYGRRPLPPQGNGGLYSTPLDYTRFVRMLMNRGQLDGRRYLSEAACRQLSTPLTAGFPTGFFQKPEFGSYGNHYAWGLGTCILLQPHPGAAAMLSPGTFGHGGAWGTQAWIDPVKGVAYLLFVQRADFPNSDASVVREAFQQAAARALSAPRPGSD